MSDNDPNHVLYSHVAATLPDSLSRRKKVLMALEVVLTSRHPAAAAVRAQLAAIHALEKAQAELPLKFKEAKP